MSNTMPDTPLTFVQYQSIRIGFAYVDDDGTPLSLPAPDAIEADIMTQSGTHVLRLSVQVLDAALGIFELVTDEVVDHGKYWVNVFVSAGGVRTATGNFRLSIERSATTPDAVKTAPVRS